METINFANSSAEATASSTPSPVLTLLETSIPGFSLLTKILSEYLQIDVSQYFGLLLILVGVVTIVNYCTDTVRYKWNQYCMSTAEIRYNDELYNYLMYWISKNGLSKRTSHFIAATSTNSAQVYSVDEAEEDNEFEFDGEVNSDISKKCRNWDRLRTLRFTPSSGTHHFRYKGYWIAFSRTQEKDQSFYGATMTDQISLSCYSRNPQILKDLLQEAQIAYLERDGNKTVIYRGVKGWGGSSDDMSWERCMSRPPRDLSTVVLDEGQKQAILADMQEYLHPSTKKWYSNRGIPYRRGYLLHGPPGTGKTSLCFALAGLLQLCIYVTSLNAKNMTEEGFASLFRALPQRCIVLLEDIDAAGLTMSREEVKEEKSDENTEEKKPDKDSPPTPGKTDSGSNSKGITLSGFLNIIDGVASSEGRILVMTSNHIEQLDAALLRPGRVDLTVHFGRASLAALKGIFLSIYSMVELEQAQKQKDKEAEATKKSTKQEANGHTTNGNISNGHIEDPLKSVVLHHGKSESEIRAMADDFASRIPPDVFTPAEIQGYLLKFKKNPQGALDGIQDFLDNKAAEKTLKSS